MHVQTIKCVFNRIGMPKLLGLVKFRLTKFLKDYLLYFNFFKLFYPEIFFMNTQEFCVLGLLWQLPYLHLAVCFVFVFCQVYYLTRFNDLILLKRVGHPSKWFE